MTDAVTIGLPSVPTSAGFDAGMTTLSPDALLAYCQAQLGDLDSQVDKQMTAQQTALREREAVESAQSILNQFGTAGPTSIDQMTSCVTAIDNAIQRLPAGDPVAAQLANFEARMTQQYDYKPGRPLTADEQAQFAQAQSELANPSTSLSVHAPGMGLGGLNIQTDDPNAVITNLNAIQSGTFKQPNDKINEWQGTTDDLGTVAKDIQSSAEIQMLQLQDLVSQRQQAVQLCSGMMSKTDQALEDQAKAIGR